MYPTITKGQIDKLKRAQLSLAATIYIPIEGGANNLRLNTQALRSAGVKLKQQLKKFESRQSNQAKKIVHQFDVSMGKIARESRQGTLVFFLSPGKVQVFFVPLEIASQIRIAKSFYLAPLQPVFQGNGKFFALALSQRGARLFEGSHYEIREINLEGIHKNLPELLRLDEISRDIQAHSVNKGGMVRSEGFHGHGSFKDQHKDLILEYFRIIEDQLQKYLKDETAPLVLLGVDYLLPIYRKVCRYSKIVAEGVFGNFDKSGSVEVHAHAWPIACRELAKQS